MEIESKIKFGDENVKKAYEALAKGRFEEKQLKGWLDRAFSDLEKNAFCGIQIPKRLIPREYNQKFGLLDNLWKYNLPNAWRLIYTIKKEGIIVLSVILEWFDHKGYERKFRY